LVGHNEDVIEVERSSFFLADLTNLLSERYGTKFRNRLINPGNGQPRQDYVLLVKNNAGNFDAKLDDGDIVYLLPVLAGG
jgi:molybdopterin converting factor small subunit